MDFIDKGGNVEDVILGIAARRGMEAAREAVRYALDTKGVYQVKNHIVVRKAYMRHATLLMYVKSRLAYTSDAPAPDVFGACLELDFEPDPAQREALELMVRSPVSIVHGGPGCGKSTIARVAAHAIAQVDSRRQVVVAFAAKVALETARKCGLEGMTMHAFAGVTPGDEENPGITRDDVGTLFVDEAFSAQPALLAAMFRVTPPSCRIVFLGDPMQLAPIGDGRALHDLLSLALIPSVRLKTSHRLGASGSHLATQAERISRGIAPVAGAGLRILIGEGRGRQYHADAAATAIREYREARRRGRSCIMLTPTQYGITGHVSLNEGVTGGRIKAGDPIVTTESKPDRWTNGEKGVVTGREGSELAVTMESGRMVLIDEGESGWLPAHAMSAHRAQGLEYDEAILVVTTEGERTATRQMLVSAMTRAKSCTVITEQGCLHRIVTKDQVSDRPATMAEANRRIGHRI